MCEKKEYFFCNNTWHMRKSFEKFDLVTWDEVKTREQRTSEFCRRSNRFDGKIWQFIIWCVIKPIKATFLIGFVH